MKRLCTGLIAAALVTSSANAQNGRIERGQYLAEEVAKCQECHSMRLANGEFDRSVWLKGGMVEYSAGKPPGNWTADAPDITSGGAFWKKWGEKGMLHYLETGTEPGGRPGAPPMPAYKLRRDDAEALVAYLKSLK